MVWPAIMSFLGSGAGQAIIGAAGSVIGGALANRGSRDAGDANAAMQRQFAQQGIRWRVEDAKAAGIHPLYALGASTHSFAPSYVGGGDYGLSAAGQDIARAIDATRTGDERREQQAREFMLARERESDARVRQANMDYLHAQEVASRLATDEAQRQLYYSQARKLDQERNPSGPSLGKGTGISGAPTGGIKYKPDEVTSANPLDRSRVAGVHPVFKTVRLPDGSTMRVLDSNAIGDADLANSIAAGAAYSRAWWHDLTTPTRFRQAPFRRAGYVDNDAMLYEQPSYQRYGVNRRGR